MLSLYANHARRGTKQLSSKLTLDDIHALCESACQMWKTAETSSTLARRSAVDGLKAVCHILTSVFVVRPGLTPPSTTLHHILSVITSLMAIGAGVTHDDWFFGPPIEEMIQSRAERKKLKAQQQLQLQLGNPVAAGNLGRKASIPIPKTELQSVHVDAYDMDAIDGVQPRVSGVPRFAANSVISAGYALWAVLRSAVQSLRTTSSLRSQPMDSPAPHWFAALPTVCHNVEQLRAAHANDDLSDSEVPVIPRSPLLAAASASYQTLRCLSVLMRFPDKDLNLVCLGIAANILAYTNAEQQLPRTASHVASSDCELIRTALVKMAARLFRRAKQVTPAEQAYPFAISTLAWVVKVCTADETANLIEIGLLKHNCDEIRELCRVSRQFSVVACKYLTVTRLRSCSGSTIVENTPI